MQLTDDNAGDVMIEVFIGKTQEAVKELELKLGLDLGSPATDSSKL